MRRALLVVLVGSWVAASLAACGGGGGGATPGADTTSQNDAVAATDVPADGDTGPVEPPPLNLDFRIAYTYSGRVPNSTEGQGDLFLMHADGSATVSVTDFLAAAGTTLTCTHSCFVDGALRWLAVAEGPRTLDGFAFQVGRIRPDLTVNMAKAAALSGVIDLAFSGDYLYYSKLLRRVGIDEQFEFFRVDLDNPQNQERLFVFPPDELLARSLHKGHFRVSPNGREVALLRPTIASQSVFVWQDGVLERADEICEQSTGGQCVGTGSQYTDRDPFALSPDGTRLAVFIVTDNALQVLVWDLLDLTHKGAKNLAEVPPGEIYVRTICDHRDTAPFAYVGNFPKFSPDGEHLVFVGYEQCDPTARRTSDIYRIRVARLFEPGELTAADVENLTQIPRVADGTGVTVIDFDQSPDGSVLAYLGSPTFDQSGNVIPATSSRLKGDAEVYVQGIGHTERVQLTNQVSFKATSVLAVPSQGGQSE